jgi:hypothetical protein
VPLRIIVSAAVTEEACILTNTSLALGVGFAISLSWNTSGDPYFVATIAFMVVIVLVLFLLLMTQN